MRILHLVAGEKWTGAAAVVFDQTAALVQSGTYNFSLVPDSTDGISFNSSENTATTKRPQLVITTG